MIKKLLLLCLGLPAAVYAADLPTAPKCDDKKALEVLSNAFAQQGKATGVNMTVQRVQNIQQTAYYAENKIRQCKAQVNTEGGNYSADYTIAVQGEQFFVQAENVFLLPQ